MTWLNLCHFSRTKKNWTSLIQGLNGVFKALLEVGCPCCWSVCGCVSVRLSACLSVGLPTSARRRDTGVMCNVSFDADPPIFGAYRSPTTPNRVWWPLSGRGEDVAATATTAAVAATKNDWVWTRRQIRPRRERADRRRHSGSGSSCAARPGNKVIWLRFCWTERRRRPPHRSRDSSLRCSGRR